MQTPWGPSQIDEEIAAGIIRVHTAGHGGFYLTPANNGSVHKAWRKANGFYEEDEEWSIVALTFPQHFTAVQIDRAHRLSKTYRGDKYEVVFKDKLTAAAPAGAGGNGGNVNEVTLARRPGNFTPLAPSPEREPNGGSNTMTEAAIELHRPEPREDQRWARVTVDGDNVYDALLTAGRLWNGWECPSFPRDQVDKMAADFAKAAEAMPEGALGTLRWAADDPNVVEFVSSQDNKDGDELREGDEPWIDRVAPDGNGMYDVGGFSWCWYQVWHELVLTTDGEYAHLSWGVCSCGEWKTSGASRPAHLPESYQREHLDPMYHGLAA